jgi:hypothetical protein
MLIPSLSGSVESSSCGDRCLPEPRWVEAIGPGLLGSSEHAKEVAFLGVGPPRLRSSRGT